MMRCLLVTLLSFMPAMIGVAALGRDDIPRLRTTDRHIRALLDEGLAHSPSLRALVDRLARGEWSSTAGARSCRRHSMDS